MTHSPVLAIRYARVHRTIRSESLTMMVVGILMLMSGLLIEDIIIVVTGIGIAALSVALWFVRAMMALWRRSLIPSLLFLSENGIGAILSDTSSLLFPWETLRARSIVYGPAFEYAPPLAQLDEQALVLTEPEGHRIYITHDFSGYDELVAILSDYGVPITGQSIPRGGTRSPWQGGWELSAGGFSN